MMSLMLAKVVWARGYVNCGVVVIMAVKEILTEVLVRLESLRANRLNWNFV